MEIRSAVSMTDEDLAGLWDVMVRDGAASAVFYDCEADLEFFREFIRRPGQDFNFVFVGGKPRAFFWLNGHTGLAAMLHFGFLKAGLAEKLDIGREVLARLWSLGFRCLLSLTPIYNAAAVSYGQALGGRAFTAVPGACFIHKKDKCVDGVLLKFVQEEN